MIKNLFSLFISTCVLAVASEPAKLDLIPQPQQIELTAGKNYSFRTGTVPFKKLHYNLGNFKSAKHDLDAIKDIISCWFVAPDAPETEETPPWFIGIMTEDNAPMTDYGIPPEGYLLSVAQSGSISITATDLRGVIYALATLKQLRDINGGRIPCSIKIKDSPRFPYRGFMLDSSRHIQSVACIKQILEQMAQLKLNTFHWHLTDDYGWRVPISNHPRLTQLGANIDQTGLRQEMNGFYTVAQIKEILHFARTRGITVIPEIDVPGHSAALTAVYPHLLCPQVRQLTPIHQSLTAKDPNSVLCLSNNALIPFLEEVILEVAQLFETDTVHIGGDEAKDEFWKGCPDCSKTMRDKRISAGEFQRDWFLALNQRLAKRGIKTICWVENAEKGLPSDMTAQGWRGRKAQTVAAANAGLPAICSDGEYAYLDYPGYHESPKPKWMPTLPLEEVYNYDIPTEKIKPENRHLVLGGEATIWTENILENGISAMMYPRIFALADKLWSPLATKDLDNFKTRLAVIQPTWEAAGITFEKPYSRESIRTQVPCKIQTTMPARHRRHAELAFDGNDTTFYISNTPPKAGDTFTITFDTPMALTHAIAYTGCFYCHDLPEGQLQDGVLEYSTDGISFTPLPTANPTLQKQGFYMGAFPTNTPTIKALRLKCTKDQPKNLVIADFILRN